LERNRGLIAFPWPLRLVAYLTTLLPSVWLDRLAELLPRKA
jgi:hypothetical protein